EQVGAEAAKDLAADPLLLPKQPQQQMLAADMVVSEQPGFLHRVFDDLLHPRAEGNLAEGHRRPAARQVALDLEAHLLRGQTHLLQNHESDAVRFTEDSEDEMFRAQIIVLVALSLFPSQDDDLPAFVRESFEHPSSLL